MVYDCMSAVNNKNVWMICETEYNALKSEQTDNLTVCKKYQILKNDSSGWAVFYPHPVLMQFSAIFQRECTGYSAIFFCCQMREMCGVIFSMSHAFSGLSGRL